MGRSKALGAKKTGASGSKRKAAATPVKKQKKVKAAAKQTAAGASTSTAASSYKVKVLQHWDKLDEDEQTLENVFAICCTTYKKTLKLTTDDTYVGHLVVGGESHIIEQVSGTVLDIHKCWMQMKGQSLSDDFVNSAFGPEYATNITWRRGKIELVTIKYIGMELLPDQEMVLEILTDDGVPSDDFMEFIYNVLHLGLRDAAAIKAFAGLKCDPQFRAFLLDEEDVQKLTEKGIHEAYTASVLKDTLELMQAITDTMKHVFGMSEEEEQEEEEEEGDGEEEEEKNEEKDGEEEEEKNEEEDGEATTSE